MIENRRNIQRALENSRSEQSERQLFAKAARAATTADASKARTKDILFLGHVPLGFRVALSPPGFVSTIPSPGTGHQTPDLFFVQDVG